MTEIKIDPFTTKPRIRGKWVRALKQMEIGHSIPALTKDQTFYLYGAARRLGYTVGRAEEEDGTYRVTLISKKRRPKRKKQNKGRR